ncbi:MAG: YdcF family protein [Sulfurospirillaceae bacterium]|nr:YdcF family protein [Sulfurospirillaceae bacterium]
MGIMYIISKLFTFTVLSPVIFIIALFAGAFLAKKFKKTILLCALVLYLLSISFVSNILLSPLERPYNLPICQADADAVIVLSGGHIPKSANLPLGSDTTKRALWGVMLAKSKNLPLLFSGAGLKEYKESDAFLDMAQEMSSMLELALPQNKIFTPKQFSILIEDKSLDTYENAKLSQKFFKDNGIENPRIYLVTSAYHMERSKRLYEHFGFKVTPSATDFKLGPKEPTNLMNFVPNFHFMNLSYTALHEYAGLLSLKLRGV